MDHHQATAQHRRRQRRRQPLHHDVRRQGKEAEKSDHPNRCLLFLFFRHRTDRRLFCLFVCFFVVFFVVSVFGLGKKKEKESEMVSGINRLVCQAKTHHSLLKGPYRVLEHIYRVSRTFNGFRGLLLGFVDLYRVSQAFTEFRGLLPSFTGFYWVSRTFTGFHGLFF